MARIVAITLLLVGAMAAPAGAVAATCAGLPVTIDLGTAERETVTVFENSVKVERATSPGIEYPHDGTVILHLGSGADRLDVLAEIETLVVCGGRGKDRLNGGPGRDRLFGGANNDTIYAAERADVVEGGGGDDFIDVGQGPDVASGGPGDDVIVDGDRTRAGHPDVLRGGPGNDALLATMGNDTLLGGHGNDHLRGFWGTDELRGGPGDDRLSDGGEGDELRGGSGTDACADEPPSQLYGCETTTGD